MGIRKFKDRKPALPFKWHGVELQFYERFPEADETEKRLDEEGQEINFLILYAYEEYKLAWRKEFGQGAEYDGNGGITKQDYVTEHFDELLEEAKQ